MCGIALIFPVGASAQQVLNGSISGLTLPMTQNGVQVTHLTPGAYTFSLADNSGQHSIHVSGPWGAFGYTGLPVNFGTAGPDGVNVPRDGHVRLRQHLAGRRACTAGSATGTRT